MGIIQSTEGLSRTKWLTSTKNRKLCWLSDVNFNTWSTGTPSCCPLWRIWILSANSSPSVQFSLSHVQFFVTPWFAAYQISLSITNSQSLLEFMFIKSVMSSNLILLSPCPPTFNISQHQGLFKCVSSSHQVAKVLEFQLQHQSFQWLFRNDFL